MWIDLNEELRDRVIQPEDVPQDPITPEEYPEVSSLDSEFILPQRNNRGKPPKRYVPEDGTSEEIRYPIANYTTTEKMSEPLKSFVNRISSVVVPEKLEEALKDQNWVKAMKLKWMH